MKCETYAVYLIENKTTVRAAAKHFNVSKSAIHWNVTKKLYKINRGMYFRVQDVLTSNKSEWHLRGGEATRIKWEQAAVSESELPEYPNCPPKYCGVCLPGDCINIRKENSI